jgi:hypothetical protein
MRRLLKWLGDLLAAQPFYAAEIRAAQWAFEAWRQGRSDRVSLRLT